MTEPRHPRPDQAGGEHRESFAAWYANGYGHHSGDSPVVGGAGSPDSAGTAGYDPAATQYSERPDGYAYAHDDAPGYDSGATQATAGYDSDAAATAVGYEGYDLSAIGGTATYSGRSPAESAGSAAGTGPAGSYDPGATAATASYSSDAATAAGSIYRVGRDGSVKKLGVDTETGLPPVGGASPPRSSSSASHGPRRARLQLKHIDPWSVMKFSLVMLVALFLVWMIVVGLLYGVLSGMGVFDKINSLYDQVHGGSLLSGSFVLGGAAVIGAVNIVLMTALATVGAFVYNLCSDLVGGVELTLSERD